MRCEYCGADEGADAAEIERLEEQLLVTVRVCNENTDLKKLITELCDALDRSDPIQISIQGSRRPYPTRQGGREMSDEEEDQLIDDSCCDAIRTAENQGLDDVVRLLLSIELEIEDKYWPRFNSS